MIYGSEQRRKKELEELHEKALEANELNLKVVIPDKETSVKTMEQPKPRWKITDNIKETSFADMIRAMPSDPNTPLLTPDYGDNDSTTTKNENIKTDDDKNDNATKETTEAEDKDKNRDDKLTSSTQSQSLRLPKSENIVPFQPGIKHEPTFDVKDEIEAIRKQVVEKKLAEKDKEQEQDKKEISIKPVELVTPKPLSLPPPQSSLQPKQSRKTGNIIFDPVPGLFPKLFVDRFFKRRRVRVIMYGPKNSKKEYVVEGDKAGGDKDKLADTLARTNNTAAADTTTV